MTEVFGVEQYVSAVSLAQYANVIGYTDCAFYGVSAPTNIQYACREIWTRYQRDDVANYLWEAQSLIENELGYPVVPTWIVDEMHSFKTPLLLDKVRLLALGVKKTTILASATAVVLATDPATITFPTTLTVVGDVHVYYPGTDDEIFPNTIEIVAGNMVITVPRCRLVQYLLRDNPETGLDYNVLTNFQTTVDVKQYENDPTDYAHVIFDPSSCSTDCATTEVDICAYIDNALIGKIRFGRLDISTCSCQGLPERVRISYRAGFPVLPKIFETAIIRLAHSLMPNEPCGCDVTQRLWKRDRNIPVILDQERLNCPFGLSDGAWFAWRTVVSMSNKRMTEFAHKSRHG